MFDWFLSLIFNFIEVFKVSLINSLLSFSFLVSKAVEESLLLNFIVEDSLSGLFCSFFWFEISVLECISLVFALLKNIL